MNKLKLFSVLFALCGSAVAQTTQPIANGILKTDLNANSKRILNLDTSNLSIGTVTSFSAGDLSPLFTTSEATTTTTPALTFTLSTHVANTVFAGPTTGADAAPTFRALVAADIPSLSGTYATAAQGTKADNVGAITGLVKSNGSASFSSVTDNSANWDTAYSDRNKWDGGATGLNAATGRTSLELGTLAIQNGTFSGTSSGTNTGDNAVNSLYSSLVSNATHTGDVTGATALTLATTQPAVHTWSLAQTFTVAPVFTDQSNTRTALGLGTSAIVNIGTSGATIPVLNAANTWGATQTFGTIIASGTVTGSNVKAVAITARAYITASQSISNNTVTSINYDAEVEDTDTIHDNVTNNSRLICKTAGLYVISVGSGFASNATGVRQIYVVLNGTKTIAREFVTALPSNNCFKSLAVVHRLALNDYIEVQVNQTSGGNLNYIASNNDTAEDDAGAITMTWLGL